MNMSLKDLVVGDEGEVVGYDNAGRSYRKRLLSMGLTPGARFQVTRVAPMGDPVEIRLRGYRLSLRKGEAGSLRVEKAR
jgi:ferrous iron transport protein A